MDDPKKCTKVLVESTELAEDQYRFGNTKACISQFHLLQYTHTLAKKKHTHTHMPKTLTLSIIVVCWLFVLFMSAAADFLALFPKQIIPGQFNIRSLQIIYTFS